MTTPTPCIMCGYKIDGELGTRCPECGLVHDQTFGHIGGLRREAARRAPRGLAAHIAAFVALILLNALGMGIAMRDHTDGVAVFLMLIIGISVTMGVGAAAARFLAPPHTKRLHADLWVRHLWILHLPWISIAFFTMFGGGAAVLVQMLAPDLLDPALFLVVGFSFLAWIAITIGSLMSWFAHAGTRRAELALNETPSLTVTHVLWAVITWLGCAFVGFFGGIAGTGIIFDLVNWSWDF